MINNDALVSAEISASVPDWSREYKPLLAWDPSRSLLASIRAYAHYSNSSSLFSQLAKKTVVIRYRFWSVVTGADIPINSQIGGGLLLPHPNGIVIHPEVTIGVNCLIFQQVTIGSVNGSTVPIVGGHVDIGAGAKVLGNIQVGDHAKIGANAVVLIDIPANKTAVGIPAKIINS
jgi:serine O-acetyltransferase